MHRSIAQTFVPDASPSESSLSDPDGGSSPTAPCLFTVLLEGPDSSASSSSESSSSYNPSGQFKPSNRYNILELGSLSFYDVHRLYSSVT